MLPRTLGSSSMSPPATLKNVHFAYIGGGWFSGLVAGHQQGMARVARILARCWHVSWHDVGTIVGIFARDLGNPRAPVARRWHAGGTYLARWWHVLGTLVARTWHAIGTILARCWHAAWHYRWDLCPGLGAPVGKLARWWHVLDTIVARGWHHRGTLLCTIIRIFARDLEHPRATWHAVGTIEGIFARVTRGQHGTIVARCMAPLWHAVGTIECSIVATPSGVLKAHHTVLDARERANIVGRSWAAVRNGV